TGVQRISYLSDAYVTDAGNPMPHLRAKYQAEEAIRWSGIAFSIFCPSFFMENLPEVIQGSRVVLAGRLAHAAHWVAAEDYARMVSRAFQMRDAADKRFVIYGPEHLALREAMARYCAVICPETHVRTLPMSIARLSCAFSADHSRRYALRALRYYEHLEEQSDPTEADHLLGKPTLTLDQWCRTQLTLSHIEMASPVTFRSYIGS
ncbi:MAG TPA: NmrA family NAD(P)-binding protein, partial [Ktedonobacterales bacterium]|nr:NmrA family NAD(P)-binding protein [Ktedonobacterales bacterium]